MKSLIPVVVNLVSLINWQYWYVFPYAVLVAVTANASGFSGAVLFQPFFNFVLRLPIAQSIATGIATETVGMSSGAYRYVRMKKIDYAAVKLLLPVAVIGALLGLFFFSKLPREYLRLAVGLVVGFIAVYQLYRAAKGLLGNLELADLGELKKRRWHSFLSGAFSAVTGTGVAEMHQPLLEHWGKLQTKRANATAILLEALVDIVITIFNLTVGNINFSILIFSVSGVIIGAQIGALISPYLPDRILKTIFGISVFGISSVYVVTAIMSLLG